MLKARNYIIEFYYLIVYLSGYPLVGNPITSYDTPLKGKYKISISRNITIIKYSGKKLVGFGFDSQ
jgi:hypothetical protein